MTPTHLRRVVVTLALLLVAPCALNAQDNKPAAEFQSLLNLRFYEANGGFLVDDLEIVFPPQGVRRATFSVRKAGGEEVASVPLRIEPFENFPMFGNLEPDGVPGVVKIGQPGDFVMSVKIGGEEITAVPFSMKQEKNPDPFNPTQRFVRTGPWSDFAYLSARVDEPDSNVFFHWWMSLRELPSPGKQPLCTIHFMQGAQEIAASNSAIVPSGYDWQYFKREVVTPRPAVGKQQYLTKRMLTAKDGNFTVVVKVNGQPIKSYPFSIKGGQIQAHERSRLGYEPRTDFISPRLVDTSEGTTSRYHMLEAYWLKKSAR